MRCLQISVFKYLAPEKGVERVFILDFHVNVANDMWNLGFKGLLHNYIVYMGRKKKFVVEIDETYIMGKAYDKKRYCISSTNENHTTVHSELLFMEWRLVLATSV